MDDIEKIAAMVVDTAYRVHRELGHGLLESVYEAVLARWLQEQGVSVQRQRPVAFEIDGIQFDEGFRVDLLVEGCLVVELKSVEQWSPVHFKQLLTYLRLMRLPLGLLINFGASTFKGGVRRIVNNHGETGGSPLRMHSPSLRGEREE